MRSPPERWNGSHVPSLDVLRATNGAFEGMDVEVVQVPGKGLGLMARTDLDEGVCVAYYLSKLYTNHFGASTYCVASGHRSHVLDVFDRSFPPPGTDGIPYVAPLVNEPDFPGGEENCTLKPEPLPDEDGSIRRHALYTTRRVRVGEELVWDYGPGYGPRPYPSKYNT